MDSNIASLAVPSGLRIPLVTGPSVQMHLLARIRGSDSNSGNNNYVGSWRPSYRCLPTARALACPECDQSPLILLSLEKIPMRGPGTGTNRHRPAMRHVYAIDIGSLAFPFEGSVQKLHEEDNYALPIHVYPFGMILHAPTGSLPTDALQSPLRILDNHFIPRSWQPRASMAVLKKNQGSSRLGFHGNENESVSKDEETGNKSAFDHVSVHLSGGLSDLSSENSFGIISEIPSTENDGNISSLSGQGSKGSKRHDVEKLREESFHKNDATDSLASNSALPIIKAEDGTLPSSNVSGFAVDFRQRMQQGTNNIVSGGSSNMSTQSSISPLNSAPITSNVSAKESLPGFSLVSARNQSDREVWARRYRVVTGFNEEHQHAVDIDASSTNQTTPSSYEIPLTSNPNSFNVNNNKVDKERNNFLSFGPTDLSPSEAASMADGGVDGARLRLARITGQPYREYGTLTSPPAKSRFNSASNFSVQENVSIPISNSNRNIEEENTGISPFYTPDRSINESNNNRAIDGANRFLDKNDDALISRGEKVATRFNPFGDGSALQGRYGPQVPWQGNHENRASVMETIEGNIVQQHSKDVTESSNEIVVHNNNNNIVQVQKNPQNYKRQSSSSASSSSIPTSIFSESAGAAPRRISKATDTHAGLSTSTMESAAPALPPPVPSVWALRPQTTISTITHSNSNSTIIPLAEPADSLLNVSNSQSSVSSFPNIPNFNDWAIDRRAASRAAAAVAASAERAAAALLNDHDSEEMIFPIRNSKRNESLDTSISLDKSIEMEKDEPVSFKDVDRSFDTATRMIKEALSKK
jgi:hypothetical protein